MHVAALRVLQHYLLTTHIFQASITLEKFKAGELKLPAQEDVKSTVRSTVKKAAEDPIGLVTGKIDPELMTAVEKSIQQSAKIANALMAVREAQKKADAARPKNEVNVPRTEPYQVS